ncbi:hypothetical protein M5K25_020838 [Dendrobium thyrsiflorum]|uniref:DUF4283 domain-containing protein n=1 Tax=Dendrobium thyrsiflorum TaxID=117978 RepID=A0ABD0UIC2_DENTH
MTFRGMPSLWISEEKILALLRPFKFALVGKFPTRRPSLDAIRRFFFRLKLNGDFSVTLLNPSHVLIKLFNDFDYSRVFSHKSYFVYNCYMKLTKWSPLFDIGEDSPIVPIWISFPNLRPHMFSPRILHAMGSLFGRPLQVDHATSVGSRPSVARVLVELDVSKKYPDKIWLGPENFGYIQSVEMEIFPPFCGLCKCLGHLKGACKPLSSSLPSVNVVNTDISLDANVNLAMKNLNTSTPTCLPLSPVSVLMDYGDKNRVDLPDVEGCPAFAQTEIASGVEVGAASSDGLVLAIPVTNNEGENEVFNALGEGGAAGCEGVMAGVEVVSLDVGAGSISPLGVGSPAQAMCGTDVNSNDLSMVPILEPVVSNLPIIEVPVALVSNEAMRVHLVGNRSDQIDWLEGSLSFPCGGEGENLHELEEDFHELYNLKWLLIPSIGGAKFKSFGYLAFDISTMVLDVLVDDDEVVPGFPLLARLVGNLGASTCCLTVGLDVSYGWSVPGCEHLKASNVDHAGWNFSIDQ